MTHHRFAALAACMLCAVFLIDVVHAHSASDSHLALTLNDDGTFSGRWDIAVVDLDFAMGLDANGDSAVTWDELRTRGDAVVRYALDRLSVSDAEQRACRIQASTAEVSRRSDGHYAVLRLRGRCADSAPPSALRYALFFDLDAMHRGLLSIRAPWGENSAALSPSHPSFVLAQAPQATAQGLFSFVRSGVWHIWIGIDHIAFLLSLLLPCVLRREGERWKAREALPAVAKDVAAIVTAFTVAHSITLCIAVLGWVSLPSRIVESVIAATVLLTALNNLLPRWYHLRWRLAFILGLIHGFGFASVLMETPLSRGTLASALVGFNLGVELGQLAIVAAFLPLAWLLRGGWFYQRLLLAGGSAAIALVAVIWLLERGLAVTLLPA